MYQIGNDFAAEKLDRGWRIYNTKSPYSNSINIDNVVAMNLADLICSNTSGCPHFRNALEKLEQAIDAIKSAIEVSPLWMPSDDWEEKHADEAIALCKMMDRFRAVIE